MVLNLNWEIIWVFVNLLILFLLMKKFLFGPIKMCIRDRCNPVMWFFLRQVNHDWVSFCDHQVLERLQEGYDPGRLTGTSAIFDGEKDLKEQAEAAERRSIAPKGRTLVAVCVTVVLLCSSLLGTVEKTVEIRPWWEGDGSRQEMRCV